MSDRVGRVIALGDQALRCVGHLIPRHAQQGELGRDNLVLGCRFAIVLLSTHLVDEAERCDRVVMLHQGRIVADGHPAALCQAHLTATGIMIRTTAGPPSIKGLTWERSVAGFFTATTNDAELVQKAAARLLASGVGFSISPSIVQTLADVFERLTGAPLDDAQRRSDDT